MVEGKKQKKEPEMTLQPFKVPLKQKVRFMKDETQMKLSNNGSVSEKIYLTKCTHIDM